jgi:hypothetical protein
VRCGQPQPDFVPIKNGDSIMSESLFSVTVKVLTEKGCPADLAQEAATVVAKDDPTKTNLGRTEANQQTIQKTLPYLQKNQ